MKVELQKVETEVKQTSEAASTSLQKKLVQAKKEREQEVQLLNTKWKGKCDEINQRYTNQIQNLLQQQEEEKKNLLEEHSKALEELKRKSNERRLELEEKAKTQLSEAQNTTSELQTKVE